MNLQELTGKKVAIIAVGDDERGKTEGAVFIGITRWSNMHLYLDHGGDPKSFEFPDDVLVRIKPVPTSVKRSPAALEKAPPVDSIFRPRNRMATGRSESRTEAKRGPSWRSNRQKRRSWCPSSNPSLKAAASLRSPKI